MVETEFPQVRIYLKEMEPAEQPEVGTLREIVTTVARYVGGQLMIAGSLTLGYAVSFWLLDVPLWFLVAPLCGLTHLIPSLGVLLGAAIPIFVILIAGTTWTQFAGVAGTLVAANLLETFVLAPLIHGKRLRLHPLVMFVGVIAGSLLFGFLGALFAVPVMAVAAVLWRRFRRAAERA